MTALAVALGVLAAILAGAVIRGSRASRRLEDRLRATGGELERLQQMFSRFAPEAVVDEIIATGVHTRGEKREVTVLFADLVDFTRMSEDMDPTLLVEVLNGYFRRMSEAITTHRGHVSKFIGDGILALFGAIEPNPWQCNDAVHAALAMRAALERYNLELAQRGLPALRLGVGIHRGAAVAGLLGSAELMEYTVVGAAVNLASRVEGLTRQHDVDLLVTEAVRASLDPRFELLALPALAVKGVREPVTTYAVLGHARERAGNE
jgi:class 3 adenylate cyclase